MKLAQLLGESLDLSFGGGFDSDPMGGQAGQPLSQGGEGSEGEPEDLTSKLTTCGYLDEEGNITDSGREVFDILTSKMDVDSELGGEGEEANLNSFGFGTPSKIVSKTPSAGLNF